MPDDQECIIVIERTTGIGAWLSPLEVTIDGREVGQVRGDQTREFSVAAGDHLIVVRLFGHQTASFRTALREMSRLELVCTSNQPPLHRWHVKAIWCLVALTVVYGGVGHLIPAIRKFVEDNLILEMAIVMVLGVVGMIIYIRKGLAAGHPSLLLTVKSLENSWNAGG